jgi:hypothetical protein
VSRTLALLKVSPAAYAEIRAALGRADYLWFAEREHGGKMSLDMTGIALFTEENTDAEGSRADTEREDDAGGVHPQKF